MQTQTPNPKERDIRVTRARANELQKIEFTTQDAAEFEIDVKILNKLQRKMQRQK